MSKDDRRKFIKFAGVTTALTALSGVVRYAQAATWTKIPAATGAANTWRKLNPLTVSIGASNVACGHAHSLAFRSDGLVFAAGSNSYGQLGDNTTASRSTYIQSTGISNAVAISCGYRHSLALRSDGLVFASGYNLYGQLGDNTSASSRSTYIQSTGVSNAVAIACGYYYSLALRSDGLVFACGYNNYGQLGDNTTGSKNTYIQSTGISNAVAIAGSKYYHNLALRSDGLVFATGCNNLGQLGDNTTVNRSTYVQSTGISNAIAIAAGKYHSLALRSNGLVFACGDNSAGQLGNNTTISRSTYIQSTGISNAIAIAAGYFHSLALRSDGLVFAAGSNSYGQLGDNTAVLSRNTYIQSTGISNAVAIACGGNHNLVIRSDGLVFAAGYNLTGQLGDNSTVTRRTYIQSTGI